MTTEEKLAFERNNSRLLAENLKKEKQKNKLLMKERDSLKQDLSDVEEFIELKRCEACKHLVPETIMSYVGNEEICENCRTNGFGE